MSLFRKDPDAVIRAARHSLIAVIAAIGVGLGALQAAAQDEGGGHDAAAEGEAETLHYPLEKPALLDWSFAGVVRHLRSRPSSSAASRSTARSARSATA